MKPCHMNRRTLLRGAGISLALPWLEIMGVKARAAEADVPRRMACLFFPNGVSLPEPDHPDYKEWNWFPLGAGRDFKFTRTLESLEPLRADLSVLSGLSNPSGRKFAGHSVSASFLTAAEVTRDASTNSISIDQFYADHAGGNTRLHSLILSTNGGVGPGTRTHTLSFTKEGQPIYAEDNLRRAFTAMFVNDAKSAQAAREALAREKSMLDSLLEDARSVHRKLGKADQEKLAEYLSSVRDVELRVERTERWLDIPKPAIDPESLFLEATRQQPLEYVRALYDLIFLAFQTDTTRAATCLIGSEGGGNLADNFPAAIGLGNHHGLSHAANKSPNGYKNWALYDQFLAEQLAYFLKRLKDTAEGDSNLLDRSLIFYGCSTSTTHTARNYPLILAGGREFGLKHGQFHKLDEEKVRLSDLFVTMLNALGAKADRFADSTGSLDSALLG